MGALAAPIDLALRAVELVQADPARAAVLAEEARQAAEPGSEAELVAEWAAGLSLRECDRLEAARDRLRHAAELARRARMRHREGQISSSLALVELYRGESRAALRAAGRAAGLLEGADAARNAMQRGLILQRLGRDAAALGAYDEAMPGLQRAGDRLVELRLRLNRSVLYAYRGELQAATRDLETAIALARALDQGLLMARCAHNLGFVAGRGGDVPAALGWFDEAEARYREAEPGGAWQPVLEVDRAELLLSAGLAAEARTRAQRAVHALVASGNAAEEAEARLLAARAALASGEHATAAGEASAAAEVFRRQRRASWALLADAAALGAQAEAPDVELHGRARDATTVARRLERAGRRTDAHSAHILAGRLALAAGDRTAARAALAAVGRARPGQPALLRIQAWHATALLRALEGDRAGARRAVSAGLRVLDAYRQTFGAEELRAGVAVHGVGLARVAVRLATEADDAWASLAAVESVRAASLELPPARPPRDDELAGHLSELRALDADLRAAPSEPGAHDRLLRRRAALEAEVRGRVRARAGADAREAPARLQRDRLIDALGPATLLAYFVEDGTLHAIAVAQGRARLHRLGRADDAIAETAALLFALRRLVRRGGSEASTAAALASLRASAARIAELVLPELDDDAQRLVVVPTGALHRLPWGALPEVAGRALTVAPSVGAWLRALGDGARPGGPVALIAGPDLPAAAAEVAALARAYPGAIALGPAEATVEAALAALDGAAVAHLAAHGELRTDNPLFSSLRLADGPLTVHDLDTLGRAPGVVVLGACDTAASVVGEGDELLGLAAALLRLGSRSLVAPLVPVPDEETRPLLELLHAELARGADCASALAAMRASAADAGPRTLAAAAAFVALGA